MSTETPLGTPDHILTRTWRSEGSDELVIDFVSQRVTRGGAPVHLTPKELQCLLILGTHAGTLFSKALLLYLLYGGFNEPHFKIIDVYICKIRRKIGPRAESYIQTVWGRGYTLPLPSSETTTKAAKPPPKDFEEDASPVMEIDPAKNRVQLSYVMGPDGSPLTLNDLPPDNTRRWVIRRKAEVVLAVRGGLLSFETALRRYNLHPAEFRAWQKSIDRDGILGLRATRVQRHRV